MTCAACNRVAESGLKRCSACNSVRYCNVDCQRAHRKVHRKECVRIAEELERSRRAAAFNTALSKLALNEVVDTSPPTRPDCDICMHVMPPRLYQTEHLACCGNIVCLACSARNSNEYYSPYQENFEEGIWKYHPANIDKTIKEMCCPFCRSWGIVPMNKATMCMFLDRLEQRAKKKDSRALVELAKVYLRGIKGVNTEEWTELWKNGYGQANWSEDLCRLPSRFKRDRIKAIDCLQKAADLGNGDAYYALSQLFYNDQKDASAYFDCLNAAANKGVLDAHRDLAEIAAKRQAMDIAMAHHKILAAAGYSQDPADKLLAGYRNGHISKEEVATSLRAWQSARDEVASENRVWMSNVAAALAPDGTVTPSRAYV